MTTRIDSDNSSEQQQRRDNNNDDDCLQRHHACIRPYSDTDNAAMQDMEKACIQGDPNNFTWYAIFDDFADRAKKYEHYNILVMEQQQNDNHYRAIGTASVGIKRINWLNEDKSPTIASVGHAFNLRLDPSVRGCGLARPLSAERKRVAKQAGCTHLYGTIAPTNTPSLRAFRPCATLDMDYFSAVLPELESEMNDNDMHETDEGYDNDIVCKRLDKDEGLKWMIDTHGTKLFFPMDMGNVLSHKHCLGVYQASTIDDNTFSSATFALWDSSASFRWQLAQNGVELPLQRIAVVFGLDLVGTRGMECLERLVKHLRPRVLKNHERLSCALARNDTLAHELKAAPDGTLQPAAEIALAISPTTIGDETQDTRFDNVASEAKFFSDPRDY